MDEGLYTGVYIGKSICGFIPDHEYLFTLKHNSRTYELMAIADNTIDAEVDLFMPYSSEISIKRNWKIKE